MLLMDYNWLLLASKLLCKTFAGLMYAFEKNFFDGIIIARVLFKTCDNFRAIVRNDLLVDF